MSTSATSHLLPVFARVDLGFTSGEGCWLTATNGDRYLDFTSGVAVNALGHCHPALVAALQEQATKLWHMSNLFKSPDGEKLAARLCEESFADFVFFCNSGAEAMEGVIKLVRHYHFSKGNPERYRIITFEGAFHGRTLATLAATGAPHIALFLALAAVVMQIFLREDPRLDFFALLSPFVIVALPAMLLDPVAVNEVMRATAMAVNPALTSTALYEDTTDKPECGGVSANANLGVYSGSGWSSAQTRYLREPTEPTEHEVFESVIGFSSADAAAKFVAAQSNKWPVCNGRYVTTTSPRGVPRTRWVSTVSQENGMLTASSVEEGGRAWVCQHALTARNNVVVDVQACGSNVMQQGAAIAKMLADRIQ